VAADPGILRPIESYGTPEIRDKMRWAYLSRGRNRLFGHSYPKNPDRRSFLDAWYSKYDWLEYSVEKDAAFCFHCFLFKSSSNVEKEIFAQIDDKKILLRFHAYSNRRGHLPRGFRLPSMEST
jgi:hypothetical protein